MQVCDKTGVPAQPAGDDVSMVLVCVPSDWQAPQAENVYVQAAGGGVVPAAAIAWICSGVRDERDPMPPRLLLMAFWIAVAEEPSLLLPWHPLQYWL